MQNNPCSSSAAAEGIPMGVLKKIIETCPFLRGKTPLKYQSLSAKNKDKTVAEAEKVELLGAASSASASVKPIGWISNEAQLAKVAFDAANAEHGAFIAAIKNRTQSIYTEKFPKNIPPPVVSFAMPPNDAGTLFAGTGELDGSGLAGSTFKRSGKAFGDLRMLHDTVENEFPNGLDEDEYDDDEYEGGHVSTLETIYEEDEEELEEEL